MISAAKLELLSLKFQINSNSSNKEEKKIRQSKSMLFICVLTGECNSIPSHCLVPKDAPLLLKGRGFCYLGKSIVQVYRH